MGIVHDLTDLQLALMRVLWSCGASTTAEVHQALQPESPLAVTTVATLLSRLEQKQVVAREPGGRPYRYRACVDEPEVRRSMVRSLAGRLFGGDATALMSHLLGSGEVAPAELDKVKGLVDEWEKTLEAGNDER
jgi:predicted transcriptional regulator